MSKTNHEDSRAAFEEALKCENVQRLAPHFRLYQHPFTQWRWDGWKMALDWRDSQVCEWEPRFQYKRAAYKTCRGVLYYADMPRLELIPFCPACGRRVKINETNNEQDK